MLIYIPCAGRGCQIYFLFMTFLEDKSNEFSRMGFSCTYNCLSCIPKYKLELVEYADLQIHWESLNKLICFK